MDPSKHIMISTKPNKIKLSAPQHQLSDLNPVKAGKVILAENKQNKPFLEQGISIYKPYHIIIKGDRIWPAMSLYVLLKLVFMI